MCRAATCKTCQKTTWAGCGQHVPMVKMTVHASQWCNGTHTQAQIDAAREKRGGGFFARLFNK